MTSSSGERWRRSGSDTGWFTGRRVKSAFSLWRAAVSGTDILVASVFVALSLGLGAYILARAQAAAHLAFTQRAQLLQAAVTQRLVLPQEDLTALSSFLEASGMTTRRQFRLLTEPMLVRHRLVYAFEWLPLVRDSERAAYEEEARDAGLTGYRFWEIGLDGKPIEAGRRAFYVPIHFMEPPSVLALGFDVAADAAAVVHGREGARLGRDRGVAPVPAGRGRGEAGTPAGRRGVRPSLQGRRSRLSRRRAATRSPASRWRSSASRRSWTPPRPRWTPPAWASR